MRHLATLGLMLLSTAISCGELSKPQPATAITITLTSSGCTIDGVGALLQDHFDIVAVNKTSSMAVFNFHRLNDGHVYDELAQFIAARKQRITAGVPQNNELPPPMTTRWAQGLIKPMQQDTVEIGLTAGSYGIVCRRDSIQTGLGEDIYVLGPFRVV